MSNTVQPAASSAMHDLAATVMANFDQNKDGQFSFDEFATFLESFMRQTVGSQNLASSGAGTVVMAANPAAGRGATSSAEAPLPPVMAGWDAGKWTNPEHVTVKYVAGRVMARFAPADWLDAARRDEILAAFRAAGLNPTVLGKDKVDFNNGHGPIDIVQGASVGGRAWQWLPVE